MVKIMVPKPISKWMIWVFSPYFWRATHTIIASPNQTAWDSDLGSSRLTVDIPHRCLWSAMARYGKQISYIGKLWKTTDKYGKLWKTIDNSQVSQLRLIMKHLLQTWNNPRKHKDVFVCLQKIEIVLSCSHLLVRMWSHRCFILYRCLNGQ